MGEHWGRRCDPHLQQAELGQIWQHRSGRVALNFEETTDEDHVTIITGLAEIIDRADPRGHGEGLKDVSSAWDEYEASHTVPIGVGPATLRSSYGATGGGVGETVFRDAC